MKITLVNTYKIIAAASFVVLTCVQFFLVYNTYELKNERYFLSEKQTINSDYAQCIQNDKLFPGGGAIFEKYFNNDMPKLEELYKKDKPAFDSFKKIVCDSIFYNLRQANNMDSLLDAIKKRHHFTNKLSYALTIQLLDIAFESNKYIPFYGSGISKGTAGTNLQEEAWIGGTLKNINLQNRATILIVSSPNANSYRLIFSLFVDRPNRMVSILLQMMPTLLLSLFSVLFSVLIFYFTFKNWIRQKKISEMKSDFINSITHEFHTPLAAIIIANKTLQNEKILVNKDAVLPLTEVIQRQAQRLKILFEQVLDITTMNKIKLDEKLSSLTSVLDEILLDYRLKSTGMNVELKFSEKIKRDEMMLDQFWFTTIVLNILDNAVKYNNQEFKKIAVSAYDDKKNVYISFEDNGIGMKEDIRKNVFEKFYRSPHTINGQIKGVGLGLFYVKQAVDAHGWQIDLKSTFGVGSTFTITIPY